MICSRFRILLLSSLVPFAAANAIAQTADPPTQLAVEVRYYAGQAPAHIVADRLDKHWIWFGRFPRVANWVPPANSLPVAAVKVNTLQAEEGVRVWVSVLSGKVLEDERQISSYVLHEGDAVTAKELADVGVVPFDLKLVQLAPSVSYIPEFRSKATSIELVSIQQTFSTFPSIQLVVRNVSAKPAYMLEVITLQDGQRRLLSMPQDKEGNALIAPGAAFEVTVRLGTRYVPGANEYSIQAVPNQSIEIATAVFGDGSYEGDSEYAMTFFGYQIGKKAQLKRVIDLLEKAGNGTAAVTSLKDKASTLNVYADAAAVEELHRQFPQEKLIERVRIPIEVGMRRLRDEVLKDLTEFELYGRYAEANAFNSWATSAKQRYQAWLNRL